MFREPQCVQRALFALPSCSSPPVKEGRQEPAVDRYRQVCCDPVGGLWLVNNAHMVFHINALNAESFLQTCGSPLVASPQLPVYQCSEGDSVQAILFTSADAIRADADPFMILCTGSGHVAVFSCNRPDVALHQSHLGLPVSQAVEMVGLSNSEGILVSCYEEPYSEVVRLVVDRYSEGGVRVSATSLYRIDGCIGGLVYDPLERLVISTSSVGNVDVWSWAAEKDVTAQYGSMSWDVDAHGTPTCCAMVKGRLWVGTSSGHIVVAPLALGEDQVIVAAHASAVQRLLPMSLGTCLWSCASDAKVSVWSTATTQLNGSFLFPDDGLRHLCCASRAVETVLWGVDGVTGGITSFHVRETPMSDAAAHYITTDERVAHQRDHRERCTMETVLEFFCAQLQEEEVRGIPENVSLALDLLQEKETLRDIQFLPDALNTLVKGQKMLQRVSAGGDTFLKDLGTILHTYNEWRLHENEIRRFLQSVQSLLLLSEVPSSLDDVLNLIKDVHGKANSVSTPLAGDVPRESDAPPSLTAAGHQKVLHELMTEQDRRQDCEERLRQALAERHELSRKLERAHALLSDRDAKIEVLERNLGASQKAAEVTASGVAQLFDMESKLHDAGLQIEQLRCQTESLSRKAATADTLTAEVEVLQATVKIFEEKELIGWGALGDLLTVQCEVADEISSVVDDCCADLSPEAESAWAVITEMPAGESKRQLGLFASATTTLRTRLLDLETFVVNRLTKQKTYFAALQKQLQRIC